MKELAIIEKENQEMMVESDRLHAEWNAMEAKVIEGQNRKRQLEWRYKEKVKKQEQIDVSNLMGHLYQEVKDVLCKEQ